MGATLANPIVAGLLGSALGWSLCAVSRIASRMVTPDDPAFGFAKVALVSFSCMLAAIAALFMYFVLARRGFAAFGVTMVITFIVALGIEAIRISRPAASSGSST